MVVKLGQRGRLAIKERLAHRRRCTEQVQNQPAHALQVADQAEIGFGTEILRRAPITFLILKRSPERIRQRKIEVNPGDHLHDPPIAPGQAAPIDMLHEAEIGRPIFGDRDTGLAGENARHARRPQQLSADARLHEAVNLVQERQGRFCSSQRRGNEFQQRFGIIGGDERMSQRRAKRAWMGNLRDVAIRRDPQRFLFQAQQAPLQQGGRIGVEQPGQTQVKQSVHGTMLTG